MTHHVHLNVISSIFNGPLVPLHSLLWKMARGPPRITSLCSGSKACCITQAVVVIYVDHFGHYRCVMIPVSYDQGPLLFLGSSNTMREEKTSCEQNPEQLRHAARFEHDFLMTAFSQYSGTNFAVILDVDVVNMTRTSQKKNWALHE